MKIRPPPVFPQLGPPVEVQRLSCEGQHESVEIEGSAVGIPHRPLQTPYLRKPRVVAPLLPLPGTRGWPNPRLGTSADVATYAVMIRSGELFTAAGFHSFDEPPIEGAEVVWNDEQWIIDQVDDVWSSPPIVTLRRL